MAFKLRIVSRAKHDIDDAVAFIAIDSRTAAHRWKAGLQTLISSLRDMPSRFPPVSESTELEVPCRSARYHSHRVIFWIDTEHNTVYVVRVYHGARRPLTNDDINVVN